MSTLPHELDRYLSIRRSLGMTCAPRSECCDVFVDFAMAARHGTSPPISSLAWQAQFGSASQQTWSARLGMVRQFALWLSGIDGKTEVPPQGLIPTRYRRSRP